MLVILRAVLEFHHALAASQFLLFSVDIIIHHMICHKLLRCDLERTKSVARRQKKLSTHCVKMSDKQITLNDNALNDIKIMLATKTLRHNSNLFGIFHVLNNLALCDLMMMSVH